MAGVWTRNFFNLLTALALASDTGTTPTTPPSYTPPISVRTPDGSYRYTDLSAPVAYSTNAGFLSRSTPIEIGKWPAQLLTSNSNAQATYNRNTAIALGAGTTPANYEDYHMGSIISSGLTLSNQNGTTSQSTTFDSVSHEISSERTYTITNTSASNITVNEVGLYVACSENTRYFVMIYHEVFDTPIVLAPSESVVLTFKRSGEVYNYTPY